MAFHSANLKTVYEALKYRGVLIDPETAASLFSRRDLADLLMEAMQLQARIRALETSLTHLQALIEATPPDAPEYIPLVDSLQDTRKELEDLKSHWDAAEVWI